MWFFMTFNFRNDLPTYVQKVHHNIWCILRQVIFPVSIFRLLKIWTLFVYWCFFFNSHFLLSVSACIQYFLVNIRGIVWRLNIVSSCWISGNECQSRSFSVLRVCPAMHPWFQRCILEKCCPVSRNQRLARWREWMAPVGHPNVLFVALLLLNDSDLVFFGQ